MAIGFSVNLVDWENGASFEDQSHNELRQNQSNSGQFSTFNLKLLKRGNNDSRFLEKKRREFVDVHDMQHIHDMQHYDLIPYWMAQI